MINKVDLMCIIYNFSKHMKHYENRHLHDYKVRLKEFLRIYITQTTFSIKSSKILKKNLYI